MSSKNRTLLPPCPYIVRVQHVRQLIIIVCCLIATVLCEFLGMLTGVALSRLLGIDAELGQVAAVVFVIFVVDNKDAIAIVIVFAAAACCCCSCRPRRMMTIRQVVAAVAAALHGGLWQDGGSRSSGVCATCLHTILDCDN
jgi:hypothetical protein